MAPARGGERPRIQREGQDRATRRSFLFLRESLLARWLRVLRGLFLRSVSLREEHGSFTLRSCNPCMLVVGNYYLGGSE